MVPTGGHCLSSWNYTCNAPGCVGDIQGNSPGCVFTCNKVLECLHLICKLKTLGEFLMLGLGGGRTLPAIHPLF